ncbi:cold-shock protein [Streptomyces abikoensis]|uniref:cold-shock protein n=1 Tax=Streptomyces abikoensis TaxID=97398 RepID=UPI00369405BC
MAAGGLAYPRRPSELTAPCHPSRRNETVYDQRYGFIVPDRGGPDIFTHYSHVVGTDHRRLLEGEHVVLRLADGTTARM